MSHNQREVEDRRGLRFSFAGVAEVLLENPPRKISAQVTELSFRGCFLQVSAELKEHERLRLRIRHADQGMEACGEVIYTRRDGAAVLFEQLEPGALTVLQDWILSALDLEAEAVRQQAK